MNRRRALARRWMDGDPTDVDAVAPNAEGAARLMPTRVKSGKAASMRRGVAHLVREAMIATDGKHATLVTRWVCGGGSVNALPVDAGTNHAECLNCVEAADLPRGPVVYRCIADDGVVIYIGSTTNLALRIRRHKRASHWWDEADRIEPQPYPNEGAARVAEAVAITEEQPFYNIDCVPGRRADEGGAS